MRILHLISQYPSITGSGIYLREVYKNFKKLGFEQKVLCCMNKGNIIETDFDDIDIIEFNSDKINFPVVGMSDVMPYPTVSFSNLTEEQYEKYFEVLYNEISSVIESFSPDFIFSNHLYVMTSIAANIPRKCKIFGFCHGTDLRQLYKNSFKKDYIINGIRNLDGIFSLSNLQKQEIIKLFNYPSDKIKVIGGGYDSDYFYRGSNLKLYDKNSEIKIIYAGKFSRAKGVIYLMKAFERIYKSYNCKLILAGHGVGEEYEEIIDFSKKLGDKVKIYSYMPMSDIAELFRSCDIFAMPSFYEGLSLVTIEAMSCGLHVVSNRLENLINFIGNDIYSSEIFETVNMPRLYDTDKIEEDCIDSHINNWSISLENQINNLYKNNSNDEIFDLLSKFSWKEICNSIRNFIYRA